MLVINHGIRKNECYIQAINLSISLNNSICIKRLGDLSRMASTVLRYLSSLSKEKGQRIYIISIHGFIRINVYPSTGL